MFDTIFKEYNLELIKADHMLETAIDTYHTDMIEKHMLIQEGYVCSDTDTYELYHESVSNIKSTIKEFFNKIKEAFNTLVIKIKNTVKAQLVKRDANKKLKDVKKQFIENKKLAAQAKGKKVTYFDTVKYSRAYTKFINETISNYSKLCSKKYNNVQEYISAYNNFLLKVGETEDRLQLNNEEGWKSNITLFDLINKADFEVAHYEDTIKKINEYCLEFTEKMSKLADKEDDITKITNTKNITSKLSSKLSSMCKKISKSPIAMTTIAIAEIGICLKAATKILPTAKNAGYNRGYGKAYDKSYVANISDGFNSGYKINDDNTKLAYDRGYARGVSDRNKTAR